MIRSNDGGAHARVCGLESARVEGVGSIRVQAMEHLSLYLY